MLFSEVCAVDVKDKNLDEEHHHNEGYGYDPKHFGVFGEFFKPSYQVHEKGGHTKELECGEIAAVFFHHLEYLDAKVG